MYGLVAESLAINNKIIIHDVGHGFATFENVLANMIADIISIFV
jgi:hypothetical protein